MRGKMSIFFVVLCLVFVMVLGTVQSEVEAKTHVTIATASVGGAYYPIGMHVAQIWNENIPEMQAIAQATAGSPQNIMLLREGDVQAAVVRDSECRRALQNKDRYEDYDSSFLRSIAPLYAGGHQVIARKDSGVETLKDLEGLKVGVGPIGSGGEADARDIFGFLGLDYTGDDPDIEPEFVEASQAIRMLKDGQLDAAQLGLTEGSAAIAELMMTGDFKMVPWEEETLDAYLEENPTFRKYVMKPNVYPNQDYEVLTKGSEPTILALHEEMDEDLVYEMTKAIAENVEQFQEAHPMLSDWTPEEWVSDPPFTPYHRGAEKYWKEQGIID